MKLRIGAVAFTLLLIGCTRAIDFAPGGVGTTSGGPPPLSNTGELLAGQDSGVFGTIAGGGGAKMQDTGEGARVASHRTHIKIMDATGQTLIATGTCDDNGEYRVQLNPGSYLVVGPNGQRKVEVKSGTWTRADFYLLIP